jgi:hypothetical protein
MTLVFRRVLIVVGWRTVGSERLRTMSRENS